MKKNTYGVGAVLVRWTPRIVRYSVIHYVGMGAGVPQFNVSSESHKDQSAAVATAKKMNARRRR